MMRAILAALSLCAYVVAAHAEVASCYGREHGQTRTATGANYDPSALTAAHRTLPFGTVVKVCRESRCVTATINDRGPYVRGRDIDLSLGACRAIGNSGLARVSLQILGVIHASPPRHHRRHYAVRRLRRRGADRARARRL